VWESEDEPDTTTDIGLLPDAGEQSHHETDKTMEVDSRVVKCAGACKQCIACCYKVFHRYSLHSSAFTNLYLAYQYLLTLSFLQVSCERAFSKLKIIKTRLRASLGNDKLETFMLISFEKDVLDSITMDDLIHELVKDFQFLLRCCCYSHISLMCCQLITVCWCPCI